MIPLFCSQILTSDSVTVSVDAVVYYRVCNPTISVANVENAHHATRLLAQTTLRNILGTKSMSEILTDRESISKAMQVHHNSTLNVQQWGSYWFCCQSWSRCNLIFQTIPVTVYSSGDLLCKDAFTKLKRMISANLQFLHCICIKLVKVIDGLMRVFFFVEYAWWSYHSLGHQSGEGRNVRLIYFGWNNDTYKEKFACGFE